MNKIYRLLFTILAAASVFFLGSCGGNEQPTVEGAGFWGVNAPESVLNTGELITISFETSGPWEIEPVTSDGEDWVTVRALNNNTAAGAGSVRMSIAGNDGEERHVDVYITVTGAARSLLCTVRQGAGSGELNSSLISQMHERLSSDYLWNTAYNSANIDMNLSWDSFLYTNLTRLGNVNIEDGGLYREYSALSGQRYIYSYIEELSTSSLASVSKAGTKAATYGLGIGPTMSSRLYDDGSDVGLIVGYVYVNSPAYNAGLRRGDIIYGVNGNRLNLSNYSQYQQELYYNPSGTYSIEYFRYRADAGGGITMIGDGVTVSASSFDYNPVLLCAVYKQDGFNYNGQEYDLNIGYLVLEAFDAYGFAYVEDALNMLKSEGVEDLILDLRFSPGGSVALCRYLMTSIVGPSHYNDVFAKMKFNDGSIETWTFGGGSDVNGADGFGSGPDLGLDRLYVICSENTASAAEIVINSLKGIDFPVYTYGSRTEGKNVGMTTSIINYGSRQFEFAPITFYAMNAKDFCDYPDGFEVDHMVNDQDAANIDDYEPFYPYVAIDWETSLNLDIDMALNWAFINCLTGADPAWVASGSSYAPALKSEAGSILGGRLQSLPMKREAGRYGSLVDSGEVIDLEE